MGEMYYRCQSSNQTYRSHGNLFCFLSSYLVISIFFKQFSWKEGGPRHFESILEAAPRLFRIIGDPRRQLPNIYKLLVSNLWLFYWDYLLFLRVPVKTSRNTVSGFTKHTGVCLWHTRIKSITLACADVVITQIKTIDDCLVATKKEVSKNSEKAMQWSCGFTYSTSSPSMLLNESLVSPLIHQPPPLFSPVVKTLPPKTLMIFKRSMKKALLLLLRIFTYAGIAQPLQFLSTQSVFAPFWLKVITSE